MSNRTVEAILRLSAKSGNMEAFSKVSQKLAQVDAQAKRFNRSQMMIAKASNAAAAAMMRWVAPAAAIYGTTAAVRNYASIERSLTRTALKLGATRQEQDRLALSIDQAAQKYALTRANVRDLADAYAETGAELKDVTGDLDVLAKATQGIGAEGRDIANSWDAVRRSMGLTKKDAVTFFDQMAAGGAGGKFEGSDLARYLPKLAPIAANLGFMGTDGTARLIGLLEAVRDVVGTSEEAATSVGDFLEKVTAPDVAKRFKEAGVDIRKELKTAIRDKRDVLKVMAELIKRVTGGDATKLGDFFGEKDSRRVARLLLGDLDAVESKIDTIRNKSKGMVDDNVSRVMDDAQSKLDKFMATLSKVGETGAKALDDIGAIDAVGEGADAVSDWLDKNRAAVAEAKKRGMSDAEIHRLTFWPGQEARDTYDALARAGGYTSPEDRAKMAAVAGIKPLLSPKKGREPAVPLSAIRAATGGGGVPYATYRFGADTTGPHAETAWRRNPPMISGGRSPREAEAGSMAALNRDRNAVEFDIEQALQQLKSAGGEFGDRASEKVLSGARAAGNAFGDAAANRIRGVLGHVGAVRADPGRSITSRHDL